MADATTTSPVRPKKRRWLRLLGWVFGILILLLVVGYFVGTSSSFFKGVILPKVSASLNATVTVSDASVSPFKQVVLRDLKVQTTGTEPLVAAAEVRLRYNLMDIIGGNIHVDEAALVSPTINLIENPDRTSNLDPILKSPKQKPQPEPTKPSKPPQIDIRKVSLSEGTIRQVKLYKNGNRDQTELSHINVTAENLKNGQTGKVALSSGINLQNNPPAPGTNGSLQAQLEGSFNLALSADLKPATIQGNTRLSVSRAEGALAQVASLNANFDCDVTPSEIKQVALRLQKGDTRLCQIVVSGPFDMEKTEGRLTVGILNIDKNLLNLAGSASGMDFGPTTINSTNQITLAKSGSAIGATGQFDLAHFQLTRTNQTTPPMDLRANYDVLIDRSASNAVVRAFTLAATQNGNQVVSGELTKPMTIAWGNAGSPVGDSTLNLAVTHLQLADWKPFVGDVAPTGDVNVKVELISQQAGKLLSFKVDSEINNLTAGSGSNQISQAAVALAMRGQAADLKQYDIPEFRFQVARENQPLVTASGSAKCDPAAKTAEAQITTQLLLARLLQSFPRSDMNVSSGTADVKLHVTQVPQSPGAGEKSPAVQNVTGNFALTDLTGKIGDNSFNRFGVNADVDIGMTPQQVTIRKCGGKLSEAGNAGGSFDLNGTYDLTNKAAQLSAKLADFNQNGLRPFLQPMLGDKQLSSISLNANASVQYDPVGASNVKSDLQVTNLLVKDPKGQFPARPLETRLQLEASLNKKVADIRQCQLALTPTARATNEVRLSGRVDMSDTNAAQGNLNLTADSLDLTSYYDLFGGQKKPAAGSPAPAPKSGPAAQPAAGAEREPEGRPLPLRNFTAEAAIGRLYVHEVDITNFQTTAKIDGGHVTINPFKLAVNGAPVNSTIDLDVGATGYKYNVAFDALQVPLTPLVNSFQPERRGQLGGTFTAQAKIDGAGITGPSLQKNLNGQFDFGTTNLNLSVVNIRSPLLKSVINVVAMIPEIVRGQADVGSLVSSFLPGPGAAKTGGLAGELQKSPLDKIAAKGNIGKGQVILQLALVESRAFQAKTAGTVTLAPILTNSAIQFPVSIALSRSLAARFNLMPANAPTNLVYAPLPDFLTEVGTIGEPKTEIKKVALASTVFRSLGGMIPGNAGGIIKDLGILGAGGTGTNAPGTNQPSGLGGLLQGLGGALHGGSSTNAPPGTNQSPLNNLLDSLGGRKK
jgi:uncharacterized protein involved in outer membrane biogenesis